MLINTPFSPPYPKPTIHPDDTLYVITSYFNSQRYQSRLRLYKEFKEYVERSVGAKLVTVEVAFGDRPHEATVLNDPFNIQLRAKDSLFHKERALNIAISRLPHDWKYASWVDCDLYFSRADWAIETVHELQHWPIVQMFSEAIDLGPDETIIRKNFSFGYCLRNGIDVKGYYPYPYDSVYKHPGFNLAFTREAFRIMGGLLDIAIVGSGDYYMVNGLVGNLEKVIPRGITNDYKSRLLDWQADSKNLRGLLGYVRTAMFHKFHGQKSNRNYKTRNQILIDNKFEPSVDLRPNEYLLFQLDEDKPQLKIDLEAYFRLRREDNLDI